MVESLPGTCRVFGAHITEKTKEEREGKKGRGEGERLLLFMNVSIYRDHEWK